LCGYVDWTNPIIILRTVDKETEPCSTTREEFLSFEARTTLTMVSQKENGDGKKTILVMHYALTFLYNLVITHALEWPSLTTQWLPHVRTYV
jgi:hypothetical protein